MKKGTATTVSLLCFTGFDASILLRKIKSKKAMLQIMVKREKKEMTFMKKNCL